MKKKNIYLEKNKVGILIISRMQSSRLPGKSLMHIDSSYSVLEYVINQLKYSKFSDKIFVATTINPEDDRIISVTNKLDVTPFRGSSDNVLDRYYSCAKTFSLDIIVRITADNPLIDPQILDNMMEQFLEVKPDYSSNR